MPRHPSAQRRRRRRATGSTSCASCSRHRRARSRSARPASTTSATTRRTTRSSGSSSAQLALAAELGKPVVIHTRAADEDTLARARGLRRAPSILHCFSSPALLEPRSSAAGTSRSPATSPTRRRPSCGRRRGASRPTACSPRPTARTSRRSRCAAGRNEPAYVMHTLAALAEARGEDAAELGAQIDANADRRVRAVSVVAEEAARPALPRRREHPRRDRPPRRARPDDVVLEIGPGPRHPHPLPRRARRARPRGRARPLARAAPRRHPAHDDPLGRTRSRLDLAALEPPPDKLVANLPYNIATPIVVESLDRLPALEHVVRDGAARGRRPLLRRARHEGLRRGLGPGPARDRAHRLPSGLARGLPAAPERRVGARRVPPHRARRARRT